MGKSKRRAGGDRSATDNIKIFSLVFILASNLATTTPRRIQSNLPLKESKGESILIGSDLKFEPGKCVPIPFNQTVTKRGCISVKIKNNLCYGTCGSMFIPFGNPMVNSTKIQKTFFDCQHCLPSKYQLIRIPMYCPERKRKHRTKRVLLIHDCSCSSRTCQAWKKR